MKSVSAGSVVLIRLCLHVLLLCVLDLRPRPAASFPRRSLRIASKMRSTQVYHDPSYLQEVWALFGLGVVVIVIRFLVRLRQVGLRQFQGDDYMAFIVLGCYTADAITVSSTRAALQNIS